MHIKRPDPWPFLALPAQACGFTRSGLWIAMFAPALLTLPCPLTGLRIAMVARPNLVARASPALMAITDKADACLKEECSLDMVHDLILELQSMRAFCWSRPKPA